MSRNNTGNPLGSNAFLDFEDNVKNLDEAVNSTAMTFRDRMGRLRPTVAGATDPSGVAQVAADAADRAETARDAAFVNADVYPDITAGLLAVGDGEQFQVVEGDEIVRYERVDATTATEKARYPSANVYQRAVDYADATKTPKEVADTNTGQEHILALADSLGNAVIHVTKAGDVHIPGSADSVQEQLKVNERVFFGEGRELLVFKDVTGTPAGYLTESGALYLADMDRSVQGELKRLNSRVAAQSRLMAASGDPATKGLAAMNYSDSQPQLMRTYIVADYEETETVQRIPAVLKTDLGLLYVWGGGVPGFSGDGEGVKLYKKHLRISPSYSIMSETPRELLDSPATLEGVTKHPMLGRLLDGRIILATDERNNLSENYRQYVRFSDDEGVTFGPKTQLPPRPAYDANTALGSSGQILVSPTGRILIPMYGVNGNAWFCYSDDGGVSWTHGGMIEHPSAAEPAVCFNGAGEILVSLRVDSSQYPDKKLIAISQNNGESLEIVGFNEDLTSNPCASVLMYDPEIGAVFHGTPVLAPHAPTRRFKYQVRLSFDDGQTFPIAYQPFKDEFYVGYGHLIKLDSGVYALACEGLTYAVGTNSRESCGILIFNLKEVFDNVAYS